MGALLWLTAAYWATHVFLSDFDKLDSMRITRNLNRVYEKVQGYQTQAISAGQLLQGAALVAENPTEFIRSLMAANDINLLISFNPQGEPVGQFSAAKSGQITSVNLPQSDLDLFRRQVELARAKHAPVAGILEGTMGPILFAANAGNTAANSAAGMFSAIRLDESFNQKLERDLLVEAQLVPVTDGLLKQFARSNTEVILLPDETSNSNLISSKLLKDVNGTPLLALQLLATREIAITGKQNLQYFLGVTAAAGIVIIIVGTLLVDILVTRRIRRLTKSALHVEQFGTMEDLPRRFTKVPDEISQLALAIRRMLDRMRSSQALYRAVIETQTEMIVRYTADGEITFTNEAFAKWLGLHPKSVLGSNLRQLLAERSDNGDQLSLPLSPTNRHRVQLLITRTKEGAKRMLEWTEHAIFDSSRNLTEIQALGRDVTDQVEHESRLRAAKEQAELADHAKGEFLAVLGHETRTPLTSVLGFTSILENTPLDSEQKEYLAAIRASGNSLLTLLNDILDYTRIAAGQIELHPKTVSVVEVFKDIIATHTIDARAKQLALDTEIAPEASLYLEADETRLKQVLSSLVGNAIKFTHNGYVRFGVRPEGADRLRFFVEDSGAGIPTDKRHLLFKPFSQIQSALTRHNGGTGIGLAFSKRLVEFMGGTIGFAGEDSPGALFYFDLPIGKPQVPSQSPLRYAAGEVPVDSELSAGARILLVEDNKVNQKLATRLLQMLGYTCDIAGDGAECLEMVAERDYDLIFLDIQMPRLDGFETARQIREREAAAPRGHRSYIIALTAFTLPGDREKCLAAGMDSFVGKPIRLESLESAIDTWRQHSLAVN